MTFVEAIKTCIKKKYSKTEGRASRAEFWYFFLFYVGVIVASFYVIPYLEEITTSEFSAKNDFGGYWMIFLIIFGLGLILPFYNVHVRRLNDINTSGDIWMGSIAALFAFGIIAQKVFGLSLQSGFGDVFRIIFWTIYGIILILCLKPGDKKDNKYGKNIYKKLRK
tara:strand:- start:801 stop:1298 length:498 start_codon:yes stop_codon:yes gene_type:complete